MGDLSRYADQEIIDIISSDAEAELKKRGYAYGWYKQECFVGVVYVLVNPAFANLVKIGYADDVEKRLKSLNSNSGLPDPYHCYAIYKVKKRLEDLKLHGLIDSLDSSLRHAKNREFYEMSAEKAYSILLAIAEIAGNEEQLIKNPLNDKFFDVENTQQSSLPKTRFIIDVSDKIKEVGNSNTIPDGMYYLRRLKKSDGNKILIAKAIVKDDNWTILKDSIFGIHEDVGVPMNVKNFRKKISLDKNGKLLKDIYLGRCAPSFASALIVNQSSSGLVEWKTKDGLSLKTYRDKKFKPLINTANYKVIPNGEYYMNEFRHNFGRVSGVMHIQDGRFTIKAGAVCAPVYGKWCPKARREAKIENNVLMEDVVCN